MGHNPYGAYQMEVFETSFIPAFFESIVLVSCAVYLSQNRSQFASKNRPKAKGKQV